MDSVLLSEVIVDERLQMRAAGTDQDVVDDYAEQMEDGVEFPPIIVVELTETQGNYKTGTRVLVAGFHRFAAATSAGLRGFPAEIKKANWREAILLAVGENATHGQRRTNADKRKAVETLLIDPEWSKLSQAAIAKHCHVSQQFVSKLKSDLSYNNGKIESEKVTVKRGDSTYEMNTSNIGKSKPETENDSPSETQQTEDEPEEESPEAVEQEEDISTPDHSHLDCLGIVIPEHFRKVFDSEAHSIRKEIYALCDKLSSALTRLAEHPSAAWLVKEMTRKREKTKSGDFVFRYRDEQVSDIKRRVRWTAPYASICPYCLPNKKIDKMCRCCEGKGWTPADVYQKSHTIPREYWDLIVELSTKGEEVRPE